VNRDITNGNVPVVPGSTSELLLGMVSNFVWELGFMAIIHSETTEISSET
jgi:hypothetical protein